MRALIPSKLQPLPSEPADSAVRRHAYLLWQERGCPEGNDDQIWLEARELARRDVDNPPRPTRPRLHHA